MRPTEDEIDKVRSVHDDLLIHLPRSKYKLKDGFKPCNKAVLVSHMAKLAATDKNGAQWYSFQFHEFPELKKYFTGDEKIIPSEVLASPRFQKQGRRFLMKMHTLVQVSDYAAEFKKHVTDIVIRHQRRYRFDHVPTYERIGPIWIRFLANTIGMTQEEQKQWSTFWKNFFREAERARAGIHLYC